MARLIGLLLVFLLTFSHAREIPYTQEDRDRLIRVEENIKALNQRMDDLSKRMDDLRDDMNRRLDYLQNFMLWGFGILFGGMGIMIGFVLWDRRTALAPAVKKTKELEEENERIVKALRELAKKDPKVEEVLKQVGLL